MIDIKSTDRICISGLTGTGKTFLLRYLCSLIEPNLLIIDPLDQYDMFPNECRYIPKRETPNELEDISRMLHARSNMVLVIEEAEQYISQGRAMLPYTSSLIRMGRNWGIGVWATTRRIQDINKRFFDLAQHCFFFRCGLQSREYIANMIGKEYVYQNIKPQQNKTGYTLLTLPDYHFLYYNLKDETSEVGTLKLGGREHIKTAEKAEAPIKKEEPEEQTKPPGEAEQPEEVEGGEKRE